jgi:hypothetical protein
MINTGPGPKESMMKKSMSPKAAVHKHEAAMHPGKPKTKLAKGGVTNEGLMSMGRNMARVANQGGKK